MKIIVQKLNSTLITVASAYLSCNMYLISQVHFRCRIIKLLPQQETIFMKLSKLKLIMKLMLSEKYFRDVTCGIKSALGVRLIKLLSTLVVLDLQLYFRSFRIDGNTTKIIHINTENEAT